MKTFICPSCKKEQDTIGEAVNAFILYTRDYETGEYLKSEQTDEEFSYYYCVECGEEITDEKIINDFISKL